jgi:predicted transcriptional regulator
MRCITLELSDDLDDQLLRLSRREHRPIEETVRDIIRRRLAGDRFHELCHESQELAAAAGYTSEDQLLDEIS